jgi:hypothetical protein
LGREMGMRVVGLPAGFGVAAMLCLLSGCKLIDQTTFAPAPEAKTSPVLAAQQAAPQSASAEGRRALVTIAYATPNPDYQGVLRYAVSAAEARDRTVQYDVIGEVPSLASAEQAQRDATEVMRAIMAAGVPAARIHLGLRAEPGVAVRQVRVFVR